MTGPVVDGIASRLGLATDELLLTPKSDCALRLLAWHQTRRGGGGLLPQWPTSPGAGQPW